MPPFVDQGPPRVAQTRGVRGPDRGAFLKFLCTVLPNGAALQEAWVRASLFPGSNPRHSQPLPDSTQINQTLVFFWTMGTRSHCQEHTNLQGQIASSQVRLCEMWPYLPVETHTAPSGLRHLGCAAGPSRYFAKGHSKLMSNSQKAKPREKTVIAHRVISHGNNKWASHSQATEAGWMVPGGSCYKPCQGHSCNDRRCRAGASREACSWPAGPSQEDMCVHGLSASEWLASQ